MRAVSMGRPSLRGSGPPRAPSATRLDDGGTIMADRPAGQGRGDDDLPRRAPALGVMIYKEDSAWLALQFTDLVALVGRCCGLACSATSSRPSQFRTSRIFP